MIALCNQLQTAIGMTMDTTMSKRYVLTTASVYTSRKRMLDRSDLKDLRSVVNKDTLSHLLQRDTCQSQFAEEVAIHTLELIARHGYNQGRT